MDDYARSEFDIKTRRLFDAYLAQDATWSSQGVAIGLAFKAMYSASLDAPRVLRVTNALSGIDFSFETIQAELTRLVRGKVLRSRVVSGQRLYEVNY